MAIFCINNLQKSNYWPNIATQFRYIMAIDKRRRHVISLEKMPPEVVAAFNAKYPGGITDCEDDIEQYPKPNGELFYAVTLELPDDIYLVKIPVEIDSLDDVQQWLDSESDAEMAQLAGASGDGAADDSTLPDDNISQYKGDDDSDDE